MVSNHPRPTSVSRELRDYYLRQENGRKLLVGVKVVLEAKEAEAEAAGVGVGVAGQEEEVRTLLWLSSPPCCCCREVCVLTYAWDRFWCGRYGCTHVL